METHCSDSDEWRVTGGEKQIADYKDLLSYCKQEEANDAFGLIQELREMLNALRRKLVG